MTLKYGGHNSGNLNSFGNEPGGMLITDNEDSNAESIFDVTGISVIMSATRRNLTNIITDRGIPPGHGGNEVQGPQGPVGLIEHNGHRHAEDDIS